MATVSRIVNTGLNGIGIFTIAACAFAHAPAYVWAGMGIVFVLGALFEIMVVAPLRRRYK